METPQYIDDLIARYLAGEADSEQAALVEKWRDLSEANRRYFDQMSLLFRKVSIPEGVEFDTDHAWQKVRARIGERKRTVHLHAQTGWWRAAAMIVAVISAGLFVYLFFRIPPSEPIRLAADKQVVTDTLPDGSTVVLNRQSTVAYTFRKEGAVHTSTLQGEAYFSVKHDDKKTFIVEAQGTLIRDIGTSFNVRAYPDSATIEVVVEEGEVIFYTPDHPGIHLTAGNKGVYHKGTGTFAKAAPEPNVTSYSTKIFTFNNHSLKDVIRILNDVYDQRIYIERHLEGCKLTVTFKDEVPIEIANVIAETLGLTVEATEDTINLKGPGCGTQP